MPFLCQWTAFSTGRECSGHGSCCCTVFPSCLTFSLGFGWLKETPEFWDFLLSTVLVEQTVPLTWADSASPVTHQEIPTSYSQSVIVAQIPKCPIYLTVQLNVARSFLNKFCQQNIMPGILYLDLNCLLMISLSVLVLREQDVCVCSPWTLRSQQGRVEGRICVGGWGSWFQF